MKKHIITLGLVAFQLIGLSQTINQEQSKVDFEVSNMGLKTVEGTFKGMTGTVSFNENDLGNSQFNVCIDASTVNTESEKRDDHLKNEDFFDVSKFPTICFQSTSVAKSEDGFIAKGNLTMHGITLAVSLPFTYSNKTFQGEIELERLDYKVGEDYGGFMVGKTVEIKVSCVLN